MGLPQPDDLSSLVLRTDFSSEAAWQVPQPAVDGAVGYGQATFAIDRAYAEVTVQALVEMDATADDAGKLTLLFLADAATIEVQQDEALACWEPAMGVVPLGYGGLGRSREGAWA
jgi:hypothetical protein